MKRIDYIIEKTISRLIEQDAPGAIEQGTKPKETDNAPSSAEVSPFTPAEEKFLGKFDAYGTTHLGIIYSPSDIGIREFIGRSGNTLNCTPEILLKLLRNKIIKIVPYTGYGRNTDYTIELQLSLDDVKGMGAADKEKAEAGSGASGAPVGGEAPPPPPENAGYVPSGNLISESVKQQLLTEEFNNFVNLLAEANDEHTIFESAEKDYLIQKSKLPSVEKSLENALDFWSEIFKSMLEGWGANWDETKFIKAFNNYLFYAKGVKSVDQAKYIDAIGKIVELAKTGDSKTKFAAGDFLDDWSLGWEGSLTFSKLDTEFGSKPWNLQWLLSDDVLDYIINSDETDVVFVSVPGEKKPKAQTKTAAEAFKQKFYSRGIGTLIIPERGYGASRTKARINKNFYPAYSKADVNNLVNKLLLPYKIGTKQDPTSGNQVIDIEKLKKQTFRDTLSKDQIIKRGKYAKSQINTKIKTYFTGQKPKGLELGNMDWPIVEDIPFYKGAWVDKDGFGYVWFQIDSATSARLYPSGKGVLANTKTGNITKTGKWNLIWDRPKQRWGIQVK